VLVLTGTLHAMPTSVKVAGYAAGGAVPIAIDIGYPFDTLPPATFSCATTVWLVCFEARSAKETVNAA